MGILLARMVDITGPEGEHVAVDPMGPMLMSAVYLFLILMPIILIMLFFFYRKKLQHQQILAAIEKGHPISDLLAAPVNKETGWLYNNSAGVGLLIVAIGLLIVYKPMGVYITDNRPGNLLVIIPIILIGMGITRLMRGIYQKKEKAEKPPKAPETTPDVQV